MYTAHEYMFVGRKQSDQETQESIHAHYNKRNILKF